ncbi:hypothetical protein, partial [Corynebacterium belfantii]|uniref:hypothetical protein n=1 Tax=Corynebacterium belfantii TaxID=2014537 RepID=UPI001A7E6AF7
IQQPTGTPTATRLVRQNPHPDTQTHRQKRQYELQHTKMSQVGLDAFPCSTSPVSMLKNQ